MNMQNFDDTLHYSNILFLKDYLDYILIYLRDCLPSVVKQAFRSNYEGILFSFLINLFCSFLHKIKGHELFKDIIICLLNTISGVYLLLTTFENGAWSILLFAATATCIICIIKPLPRVMGILGLCAIYVIFNESYVDPKQWHAIRGSFMILVMKMISVAIDVDQGVLQSVSMMKLVGYLMSPCSIMYGPWFQYRVYESWSTHTCMSRRSIVRCIVHYCHGVVFLLYSTCLSQLVFMLLPENKWVHAFRDAQAFRFSHYFICYLSTSHLSAMHVHYSTADGVPGTIPIWNMVDAGSIELPRSLIDVVTMWNLPMHHWLKHYVFLPCRKYGRFAAILLTFTASSVLHGLNFALSAILISLGIYSYVEYVLRSQLARTLGACVKARPCLGVCGHRFQPRHPLTLLVNAAFTALAVFHLAYIAAMFDDSVSHSEGYNMKHTVQTWSRLHFSGHIVIFVKYSAYLLLKCTRRT